MIRYHIQCQEVTGVMLFINIHAPTDNKSNDSKGSFRRVYRSHSISSLSTKRNSVKRFQCKVKTEKLSSKRQIETRIYMRTVMMVFEQYTLPYQKHVTVKSTILPHGTFINILGFLLIEGSLSDGSYLDILEISFSCTLCLISHSN